MLSLFSWLFSSLSLRVSEAPWPDHNLKDGSCLLCFSIQNLQINWVTSRTWATVPSLSEAGEEACWTSGCPKTRGDLYCPRKNYVLFFSPSQLYCVILLCFFLSNFKNKQEVHSNKVEGRGAQALTECSANSFYDSELHLKTCSEVYCVPFFSLLIYLLPSLSNMSTRKCKRRLWCAPWKCQQSFFAST